MKEAPKDLNIDLMESTLKDIVISLSTLQFYLNTTDSKELIKTLNNLKKLGDKAIKNLNKDRMRSCS